MWPNSHETANLVTLLKKCLMCNIYWAVCSPIVECLQRTFGKNSSSKWDVAQFWWSTNSKKQFIVVVVVIIIAIISIIIVMQIYISCFRNDMININWDIFRAWSNISEWTFLRKKLTAFICKLFSQKKPHILFDWVVNTLVIPLN